MNNTFLQKENNQKRNEITLNIIMSSLIIAFVILFGLIIINVTKEKIRTRTFMIYMVGSDLESKNSMGTYELDGINPLFVDLDNVNVVLIAGGASKWGNDYIDKDETSIYRLTKDGFKKVKQQSIKNMGDTETLSNFINYVTKNYITDEYELLFWNHGGALMGSEYDELNNNDNLTLSEISTALNATSFNKSNKIETIIFSTCLNGTIENANVFKDYANYFVASEEISMSVKNQSDFSFINDVKPETNSLEIGKMFINKYKKKIQYLKDYYNIENEEYDIYSTYSIVDLNNLDNLNKKINTFFGKINISENYDKISKIRSNLYQYAYKQAGEPGYDTVDLYNLVSNLKELSPNEANDVLKSLRNTIIYNYSTDPSSRGLSIYFPYNGSNKVQELFLGLYKDIPSLKDYGEFINEFSSLKNVNSSNKLSFSENKAQVVSSDEESDFELELTDEQVEKYAKSVYIVFGDNKDGNFFPVYKGTDVKLDKNKLKAKIRDRQLKLVTTDTHYERTIPLFEEEVGKTYIRYSALAMLEDFSSSEISKWVRQTVNLSILLDKKTNKASITSALVEGSDGLPGRTLVDLNDYTDIIFGSSSYNVVNQDGTFNENWVSNGVFEGVEAKIGKFELKIQDFNDDYDYYCIFRIFDTNNNSYYSKLIKLK